MQNSNKLIGHWLLVGVIMLTIQVLLGGITRLTGSGLSITEWKPIVGVLPPLNETQWLIAFEKYKHIAQFKFVNQDFLLSDFKFIFFWEWFHRNWAHFIAAVFLIPFAYFISKKMIGKDMIPKLIILFLLGIGQGVIGKIMVESGLNDTDIHVSHIRLAIHFISALILICVTFWFALEKLVLPESKIKSASFRLITIVTIVLLFFQLSYGAFMAGLKAANVAPTWPSINGDYVPATLYNQNLINHPINVHFIHRTLAYMLLALILLWTVKAYRIKESALFNKYKMIPILLVSIQVVLGISAVLFSTHIVRNGFGLFEWTAQLHQLVAMCLLMSLIWSLFLLKKTNKLIQ